MDANQSNIFVLSLYENEGEVTGVGVDGPHSSDKELQTTYDILKRIHTATRRGQLTGVTLLKMTLEPSQYGYMWPVFETVDSYEISGKPLNTSEKIEALFPGTINKNAANVKE